VKGFGISDNETSGHIRDRDSGVDSRLGPSRLDNQGPPYNYEGNYSYIS
jgi:hypothetical protein